MQSKKRLMILILVTTLIISLCSCSSSGTTSEAVISTATTAGTAAVTTSAPANESSAETAATTSITVETSKAATTVASTTAATPTAPAPIKLTISAAASLKDVMESIQVAYVKVAPSVKITYNFGSSGTLQTQIEQGAPADLFISAAAKQMDALAAKNLIIANTRRNLLGNKLVLIAPVDSKKTLGELKDLNSDAFAKIAIGEPKTVPAGQYATEALTPNNLLASLTYKEKIVYAKDVREVLTWVETGNADAGFVYVTDAMTSGKVKVALVVPESAHKPIIYPAAVLAESANQQAATDLINYLYSDAARSIFEQFGFTFLAK